MPTDPLGGEVRAARDRTVLWTRISLLIAAVAVIAAMADTGDGHSWLEKLGGVVLGAGAWVSCNVMANLASRPLAQRGVGFSRTKLVTGAVLGVLMALAAAGIGAWYGPWSALAVGAGWMAATSLVSYAGLHSWATALERDDETGEVMREILATQRPWAAPADVAISVLLASMLGVGVVLLASPWPLLLGVLPAWALITAGLALLSGRGFSAELA